MPRPPRLPSPRSATPLFGALLILAFLHPGAAAQVTKPAAGRVSSVKDLPGYLPPDDPESTSVRIGRRLNAPIVSMPFLGGVRSLDDVGRSICWAINNARPDTLEKIAITFPEFRTILWREFPQSRPVTNATADFAFFHLGTRNHKGIKRAVSDWNGRHLEFVRFDRSDTTAVYKNFRLWNGLTLVTRNETGQEERLDVVRSVAERKGIFKIYSMRD